MMLNVSVQGSYGDQPLISRMGVTEDMLVDIVPEILVASMDVSGVLMDNMESFIEQVYPYVDIMGVEIPTIDLLTLMSEDGCQEYDDVFEAFVDDVAADVVSDLICSGTSWVEGCKAALCFEIEEVEENE